MIRFENRLEEKREPPQERLLGHDPPIEGDVDVRAARFEAPDTPTFEISRCRDNEAVRVGGLDNLEFPSQRVWQPAFREQPDTAAESLRVRRAELLDREVDRRPPTRERERIAKNVGDFAQRGLDVPF